MKHLFVAVAKEPWGELVLGLRVAAELAARGDEIAIIVPRAHELLLKDTTHHVEYIDDMAAFDACKAVPEAVARLGCDTVILVDLTIAYFHLKWIGGDAAFLGLLDVPVLALDVWNLPASDMTLDFGEKSWVTSAHALAVTRRLVPVPIIAPDADAGCYNALPPVSPVSRAERAAARAALGFGSDAPLVVTTSATWQMARSQVGNDTTRRSAVRFPALVAGLFQKLGGGMTCLHVGPEPIPSYRQALGGRYHFRPSLPQAEFRRVLAAADLLLCFNLSATAIATAIASEIPVVVGVSSYAGTADEVRARLPGPPSRLVDQWLQAAAPLHRFRAWPYGYYSLMAPVLADNPYLDAVRVCEVLEEVPFLETCGQLLSDPRARERERARQAAYRAIVARLPSAADRVAAWLGR